MNEPLRPSDGIEQQLAAVESELADVLGRVSHCVSLLRSAESDDLRFLVAERLPSLGSAALPPLRALLAQPETVGTLRYLAGWVAVELGERDGVVELMCAEVEAGTSWSLPAAGVLARHGISEGLEAVIAALRRVDPTHVVELQGYLTALRDLGGALPNDVRQRIQDDSPAWVARAVAADFPAQMSQTEEM